MMKKNFVIILFSYSSLFFSQVGINTSTPNATLDIVANPDDPMSMDGVLLPRLRGDELAEKDYTSAQRGTIVYVTSAASNLDGQVVNVDSEGIYFFDGEEWQKTLTNIYNTDSRFTSNRTATLPNNGWLDFAGNGRVGIGGIHPLAKLNVNGFIQFGPSDSHYGVGITFDDSAGEKYGLTQSAYFPSSGAGSSPGTRIYTSGRTSVNGHISFGKYTSATDFVEWARFGRNTGNLGLSVYEPTEKLDVNGVARIRKLPLNGTANSINTTPSGDKSSNVDSQTFTATKVLVVDNNGVIGTMPGLPIIKTLGDISPVIIENCPVFQNNTEAIAGGVPIGGLYRKADGSLMVRY